MGGEGKRKIQLDVVTPDRIEFSRRVDSIIAPSWDGYIGILPGHMPLITNLETGVLTIYDGDEEIRMAVREGFLEITPTKVVVLAEAAEMPYEIDVERALESKRRAEEILAKSTEHVSLIRARARLQRAMTRLKVASDRKNGPGKGVSESEYPRSIE
ncbi:MAG TPA: F0F1 ATP synthase subunit epsilon [Firmicutes bacterium]|nr:F0F1 ATP synthase subunit epsilon [Bacillota bacterium]HHY98411.1 F0F1 ATP synthase subunit epsilon [Bacillota bacterium]